MQMRVNAAAECRLSPEPSIGAVCNYYNSQTDWLKMATSDQLESEVVN